MTTALITILGKGRDNPQTGYRPATYAFADGSQEKTPYFGMALAKHLQPKKLILLGTAGSMWGVLVESLTHDPQHEDVRLELIDAETQGTVSQDLLNRIQPLLQACIDQQIELRLIPAGKETDDQIGILQAIEQTLSKQPTELHIDITHGYRHLAIIGFLSAAMLARLRSQLNVKALWYGALDMTRDGITPVLRLDGLTAVQHWVSALDRFDANGDYSVFAPLLEADGLPKDKANCLIDAAFYETTTQILNAARSLNTLLPDLDRPLSGASGLFQAQLKQKLQWAKGNNLAKQQLLLGQRARERGDYLRACILGLEALITHYCDEHQLDAKQHKDREEATQILHQASESNELPEWLRNAYRTLNTLRNSMAHGTLPRYPPTRELIRNRERLPKDLERLLGQIGTHLHQ